MTDEQISNISKSISDSSIRLGERIDKSIEEIESKISQIDKSIKNLESKMVTQEQFLKLYKNNEDHFTEIEKTLDEKASQESVNSLTNTMDGFALKN